MTHFWISGIMRGLVVMLGLSAPVQALELPDRDVPRPRTTDGVPHVQLGVTPRPEIKTALLGRVGNHPGIDIRPTIVSLPGALGFWIDEGIPLAHPEVIVRGREFAHLHPDGSLHASLSPALAARAVNAGWAIPHPWATQRPGWEGFVMIYTPQNEAELEIVFHLIVAGFDFVTKGIGGGPAEPISSEVLAPSGRQRDPAQLCSTC